MSEVLEAIQLRVTPAYRQAELLRRARGAAWLAYQSETSESYAAIRLMIATWETLSLVCQGEGVNQDQFFAVNPFLVAWEALVPAVRIIRMSEGDRYAATFEETAEKYRQWLSSSAGSRFSSDAAKASVILFA